jgi:hypothetical protein
MRSTPPPWPSTMSKNVPFESLSETASELSPPRQVAGVLARCHNISKPVLDEKKLGGV